jgi:hypothetical protein
MELIGDNWDTTHRLTKIEVKTDYSYCGFEGPTTLPAGQYYICGFWADAVGLAKTLKGAKECSNEFVLPSAALRYFWR